ncbi:DNA polymerase/3'-5' exonuclease PolX [soil metagenome]
MRNAEIADAIDEVGILYELDGAVRYRVLAYQDAAKTIRQSPVSIEELTRSGKVTDLPGIGKTLEEKIIALLDTGVIPAAEKLRAKFPPTLIEVTKIPGLGSKTVRRLFDELGVASIDDLRAAAEGEKIRELKGLGAKVEENVLASLAKLGDEGPSERVLLSEVLPIAEEIAEVLREHPASDRVTIAGSARRMVETCKDVDIIATATEPKKLAEALSSHELIATSGKPGPNGLKSSTHTGISVDLRIVEPEAYGNLLQHFSGSKAHNVALRERAVKMGLSVSEHGITNTETGKVARHETEEEVYKDLGLAYIEPELREDRGEIKAAEKGELPDLVEVEQIKGDLHCHTTLSDGKNTVEEMAEVAIRRGYGYLAITDHSASHGFGDNVPPERLEERIEEITTINASLKTDRFRILAGSEVNILPDGKLDYTDELLGRLDWVVASVHTSFQMNSKKMTERMIRAVEHPDVDCLGHPSGRKLLRREPYDFDIEKVAEAAAAAGTMIEINSNPNRRDLSEQHARIAVDAGVMIAINTDAHQLKTLDYMRYGIATARRAWLGPDQIANTRSWTQFQKLRKPGRKV